MPEHSVQLEGVSLWWGMNQFEIAQLMRMNTNRDVCESAVLAQPASANPAATVTAAPESGNRVDYVAVLADLKRRRDDLNAAIAVIEDFIAGRYPWKLEPALKTATATIVVKPDVLEMLKSKESV